MSNIISVLSDQGIPFQEPLSSLSWIDFLVVLKGSVRSFDCYIDILGAVVGSGCPDFAITRIWRSVSIGFLETLGFAHTYDIKSLSGLCFYPFAINE